MAKLHILNASDKKKTLEALRRIGRRADAKGKAVLNRLVGALDTQNENAGRARRSKEDAMAERHHKKRVTTRKKTVRTRSNPTAAPAAAGGGAAHHRMNSFKRRAKSAGASVTSRLKGVNVMALVTRGACMAGGFLAQSFVARQSERILPSLPRAAHSAIGSAVVAAAALMLAGGKPWAEDIAAAGVAAGIQGLAHEFAPGVFAGLHESDVYVSGYQDGAQEAWNNVQGLAEGDDYQYVQGLTGEEDQTQGLGGLAFSGKSIPGGIANRPQFL